MRTREEVLRELDEYEYPRAGRVGYGLNPLAKRGDKFARLSAVYANIEARKKWRQENPECCAAVDKLLQEEADICRHMDYLEKMGDLNLRLKRELLEAGVGERTFGFAQSPKPTKTLSHAQDWWRTTPRKSWLVFIGERGIGKSVAATWCCIEAMKTGLAVKVLHASKAVGLSSYGAGAVEFARLTKVGLLVLMDFKAVTNDHAREQLFQLLDDRHEARRPTIITSNKDEAEFSKAMGKPLMSRILSDGRFHNFHGSEQKDLRLG